MARLNRVSAAIALIGLLGIVSALGTAAFNYLRYQLLLIESENLALEKERAEKELGQLPSFDTFHPRKTDYKKPIVKLAAPKSREGAATRSTRVSAAGVPFQKLMKCWKCGKPSRVPVNAKRGKCPHCGAEWALK